MVDSSARVSSCCNSVSGERWLRVLVLLSCECWSSVTVGDSVMGSKVLYLRCGDWS